MTTDEVNGPPHSQNKYQVPGIINGTMMSLLKDYELD